MAWCKRRTGADVREFLYYYVLVILNKGHASVHKIVETIVTDSADNRKYRASGALRVAHREVKHVVQALSEQTQVVPCKRPGTFCITAEGRRALAKADKAKEQVAKSKDAAVEKLLSIMGAGSHDQYVLDVGTGEGYLALKLAQAGFKVLGIDSADFDYSKDSIDKAREKAEQTPNVEFRAVDVRNLRGLDCAFDFVVASQAVHCMKDQRACIEAIYRLLKPGGQFLTCDFAVGLRGFFAHGFHVFLGITHEEWSEILSHSGYVDIAIQDVHDYCVLQARKPF